MSIFSIVRESKLGKIVWIGDRALFTKQQQGRWLGTWQARSFSAMNELCQFFLSVATGENELKIWQTSDRDGNTWWHGCDRSTGSSTCVATDDEMRSWIDRRYCQ